MTDEPKAQKAELRAGAKIKGLIPQTIEEAARLAEGFYSSGMTPDSYMVYHPAYRDDKNNLIKDHPDEKGTKARLLIGILKGMEVGLPPVAAISSIYIVNNRPTIYGDGALALVIDSEDYEWHKEEITGKPKTDEWTATCTVKRVGKDPVSRSFSWSDAKAAGLQGKAGPWSKYTARQMQMRARAFALRDEFADVLMGLGITEEVADIENEKPVAKPEAQVDKWSQKAIENKPAQTVDFSTLDTGEKETVPVQAEKEEAATAPPVTEEKPVEEKPQGELVYDVMSGEFTKPDDAILPAGDDKQIDEPGEPESESAEDKPSGEPFPGCGTCGGCGEVEESVDPESGEVVFGPCPDCFPKE